jgi:hypothetical protein
MGWTARRTWVTSEVTTAAQMNEQIRDNLGYLADLAYVEFTADVSVTGTSMVDIVSSGAITYAATPIVIEFSCIRATSGGTGNLEIHLRDGATDLGMFAQVSTVVVQAHGLHVARKLTPSAASHTYVISGKNSAAQTSTIVAGAGGAGNNMPGYIRVRGIPS